MSINKDQPLTPLFLFISFKMMFPSGLTFLLAEAASSCFSFRI